MNMVVMLDSLTDNWSAASDRVMVALICPLAKVGVISCHVEKSVDHCGV